MSDFLQQTKKDFWELKEQKQEEMDKLQSQMLQLDQNTDAYREKKEETSVQQRTANRDKLKEAGTSFRENRRWVEKYI